MTVHCLRLCTQDQPQDKPQDNPQDKPQDKPQEIMRQKLVTKRKRRIAVISYLVALRLLYWMISFCNMWPNLYNSHITYNLWRTAIHTKNHFILGIKKDEQHSILTFILDQQRITEYLLHCNIWSHFGNHKKTDLFKVRKKKPLWQPSSKTTKKYPLYVSYQSTYMPEQNTKHARDKTSNVCVRTKRTT